MNIVEPFVYGDSFVHRLDPRVKIITVALFTLFGLDATVESIDYAVLITIKSNIIVIVCIALLSTCSVFKLVHALHYLYVPDKLVQIFFFSYRYIHVINLEYIRLTNAMKMRCFTPGTNLHTYKSFCLGSA